ncbi:MAG: Oxidoreductase, aldo/keto reductase family, partial [uncultured Solirubrobacteraceae bacterium]
DLQSTWQHRPRRLPDRPGRDGHVRPLWPVGRGREHRHDPRGDRRRRDPDRHGRLLRLGPQRAPHRPRAARPRPRRGADQREVRGAARPGGRLGRQRRPAGRREELPRPHAHAAGYRSRRRLPARPRRSRRADRGDRGRDRRDGAGWLRTPHRALRGGGGHAPPRRGGPPHRRPADRVLAALARHRGGHPPRGPRARRRDHGLRGALPRAAQRALESAAGARRAGLPRAQPAFRGREPRAQPGARRVAARDRRGARRDGRPGRDRMGARPGRGHRPARGRPPARPPARGARRDVARARRGRPGPDRGGLAGGRGRGRPLCPVHDGRARLREGGGL